MRKETQDLTVAALIAAIYAVLTLVSNAFGLASGAVQLRLSEALTILPAFTWAAVPGLTVGCIIANLITGCALWDIVFGSIATFIGAVGTYFIGKNIGRLITLPTFARAKATSPEGRGGSNGIGMRGLHGQHGLYGLSEEPDVSTERRTKVPSLAIRALMTLPPIVSNTLIVPKVIQLVYGSESAYWFLVVTVGIGEILSCGVLGVLVYRVIVRAKIFEEKK